eukprot:Opistho-2@42523
MSFSFDSVSVDVITRIKEDVRDRLVELDLYTGDDMLLDYVIVMLTNEKTKAQMEEDLRAFLGDETDHFVDWLWKHIDNALEEAGVANMRPSPVLSSVATVPSTAAKSSRRSSQSKRLIMKAVKDATAPTAGGGSSSDGRSSTDPKQSQQAKAVPSMVPMGLPGAPGMPIPGMAMPGMPFPGMMMPPFMNPLMMGALADPTNFARMSEDDRRTLQGTYMAQMLAMQQRMMGLPAPQLMMPLAAGIGNGGVKRKRNILDRLGEVGATPRDRRDGERDRRNNGRRSDKASKDERMAQLSRRLGRPVAAASNGTDGDESGDAGVLSDRAEGRGLNKRQKTADDSEQEVTLNMSSLDSMDVARPAPRERCQYWPNCLNPACTFVHPSEPCSNFPNCKYAKKCLYVHPVVPCKFGPHCTNPTCNFAHNRKAQHPAGKPVGQQKLCAKHPNCNNPKCSFAHPTVCHFGTDCTRPGCTFFHPSAASQTVCKFLPNCTRPGCPYKHPLGGPMHVSQRAFAAASAVAATPANAESLAAEAEAATAASGQQQAAGQSVIPAITTVGGSRMEL